MRLRLTPQAIEDLDNIRSYLLPRSAGGAERVRLAIEATVDLLALFPRIAHDTDIKDVRVIPVTGYAYFVYHKFTDKEVAIIHIRHSSREMPTADEMRVQ